MRACVRACERESVCMRAYECLYSCVCVRGVGGGGEESVCMFVCAHECAVFACMCVLGGGGAHAHTHARTHIHIRARAFHCKYLCD